MEMEQILAHLLKEMKDEIKEDMKTLQENADAKQAKMLDKTEADSRQGSQLRRKED
jgi:hypothetical protein